MPFLGLPRAVIEIILCELPATDISSCLLSSKYLNEIVTTSMRLILKRQLAHLGAEINPFSSVSTTSERLRALDESTRNWSTLTPKFIYSMDIPHEVGHVWNKEGVFFGVRRDRTAIWYMQLARTKEESLNTTPVWHSVDLGVHQLINFNLCLYEHDLLAVVTSTLDFTGHSVNGLPQFNIHVLLHRFSIQGPHPQASVSDIFVMKSPLQRPNVAIDMVGRHLVVVVHLCGHPDPPLRGMYIYVYNWQTGTLLMEFTAPMHSYETVVFLDEDLILMPNIHPSASEGQFDIFRIPPEPNGSTEHTPIVALQFPTLRPGSRYILAKSHRGTNPIAKDSWSEMYRRYTETTSRHQYQHLPHESRTDDDISGELLPPELDIFHSQRPFIMRGEDALCVFTFATGSLHVVRAPNGNVYPQRLQHEHFTMQVHRKALLRTVEQYASKPATLSRRSTRQPPCPGVEEPARNQTTPAHPAAAASNTIPQPNIAGQNQALPFPRSAPNARVAYRTPLPAISVAWAQWGGPRITRWFKTNNTVMTDLSASVGERCVGLAYETRPAGGPTGGDAIRMRTAYHMFEFNRYLCQRSAQRHLAMLQQALRGTFQEWLNHSVSSSDIIVERSGTHEPHEEGNYGTSVDDLGGEGDNMDEEGDGLADLVPETTSVSGGSEETQAVATSDDPEAVNHSGPRTLDIPGPHDGNVYDRAAFMQVLHEQAKITEIRHDDYVPLIEKAHMLQQRRMDSLASAEFVPPVVCELPCMVVSSSNKAVGSLNWEAVMIDEERLMGLCRLEDGITQRVEIHHFG